MGHLATMERRVRVHAEAVADDPTAFVDGAIGRAIETLSSPRGAASTPTLPAPREAARAATPLDAARATT